MSLHPTSVRSCLRLRTVAAHCAILSAIFVISGKSRAQNPVPPGDLTAVANEKLIVVDNIGQPVKRGSIRTQGGLTLANLDDDGQFFSTECEVPPPRTTSSPALFRDAKSHSFLRVRSNGMNLLPTVFLKRSPFAIPAQLQAATFATATTEPPQQDATKRQVKPQWQIFLESVGGAAIITVFGGGIIGALLTSFLQRGAKEREILLNQLDADKQRRLQREQIYLDGELKVVTEILEMVTAVRSKSENLIRLTTTRFSPKNNQSVELKEYRNQVRSDFNHAVDAWRSRREILGALLGTYHRQSSGILKSWIGLRRAATAFMEKSQDIYNTDFDQGQISRPEELVEKEYADERDAIEKAISEFSEALFSFRSEFNGDADRFQSAQTSLA